MQTNQIQEGLYNKGLIFFAIITTGCGAWFSLNCNGFNLRLFDIVIFYCIIKTFLFLCIDGEIKLFIIPNLFYFLFVLYFSFLIILPFYGILSNNYTDITYFSSSLRWFFTFVFIIIAYASPKNLKFFEIALIVTTIFNLIYAVLQYLEFFSLVPKKILPHNLILHSIFIENIKQNGLRVPGLQVGPNQLGWLGLFIFLYFFNKFLVKRYIYDLLVAILSFLLILLPASRTALITCITSIFLSIIIISIQYIKKHHFQINKSSITLFLSIPFLVLTFSYLILKYPKFNYIRRAFKIFVYGITADNSLMNRINMGWNYGLKLFLKKPFLGWGIDPTTYTEYAIDSGWISFLAQGGISFVLIFLLLLISVCYLGLVEYSKNNNNYLGLVIFSFSISIIIGSFLLGPIHYLFNNIVFFLTINYSYYIHFNKK